uniref:Uncharacterized protein n=1 Tax=Candidatus Kentrum sp. MB TaxID=2138164 RepID=A0A451BBF0_9GAMM|nr:MAG: hypothetical protein BECKMB1821I_GA0114274_102636 [Candidatus Kentron sp. MB]VFK75636.1 MAG: hypothetical protein BECKMB1821H_GA0114242_102735 [Candidatus Kentron sp. MB]
MNQEQRTIFPGGGALCIEKIEINERGKTVRVR